MNTNAQQLLDGYHRLPLPDRREVVREILRHTADFPVLPLSDDQLAGLADELSPAQDRTESAMSREQWERFVYRTEGSLSDPTFRRHPQGEFEQRDESFS
uniref:Addiction module component n=1 Tax=Candidatus Kentrum sp. FM TaxID=2126340 RepID=A0A450TMZ8_9GAMM|nr:MAG: hypothetical protein BECKFM1743C_GA0114222_105114 [Candidatus Kentron sp. FM]VFJ69863.1 MAG: hypothetical protein BECKFM1743A_GA0114220_105254 [Candidatus Kentron sp. FM]VFK17788.1 MAG: hypothetical protein BECKFM1743B_GA0114221_105024 [Candidatus Kentron sp. FM]